MPSSCSLLERSLFFGNSNVSAEKNHSRHRLKGRPGKCHCITHCDPPELAAYHGLYTVRDLAETTTADLASKLKNSPCHTHDIVELDLTNLDSVCHGVASVNGRIASGNIPPIRALILNAGFQYCAKHAWTDEELDNTFSANYLGHWLLTLLLLKGLDRTSG